MTDTELRLKNDVRTRDGWKCQDCGIMERTLIKQGRPGLHVHRLEPGSEYTVDGTVTLCNRCHRTRHAKPRQYEQPSALHLRRVGPNGMTKVEVQQLIDMKFEGRRTALAAELDVTDAAVSLWLKKGRRRGPAALLMRLWLREARGEICIVEMPVNDEVTA